MVKPRFGLVIVGGVIFTGIVLAASCSSAPPAPLDAGAGSTASVSALDHDDKLQAETDALLALFDKMPRVPVYLKDELIQKSGTNTEKGSAYTYCYGQTRPTIFVKKIFYQKTNRKQLVNALKHELTHAWLCRQGLMSVGHNDVFRQKFKQVGGIGN